MSCRTRGEEKGDVAGQEGGPGRSRAADAGAPTWAQELLDHLRPTGRDVRRIVAWLAEAVQGTASLQDHTGTLVAGTRIPLAESLIPAILAGRIGAAAPAAGDGHLRLVRIEQPNQASAGVLAVARPESFDR